MNDHLSDPNRSDSGNDPVSLTFSKGRLLIVFAVIVLLVAGGVGWRYVRNLQNDLKITKLEAPEPSGPSDPRLSYHGPYQNIHPDVKYVGDAQCVDCHADISKSYSQHPMGRSLTPISKIAGLQQYDQSRHNPFKAFDVQFKAERDGDLVYHRQTRLDKQGKPIYEFAHRVDYAIGSGSRGYSYLTVEDGFVMQTPISWYSQKQIWDLSPGFPPWAKAGRVVQGACLYCHANRVEPEPHTRNQYQQPVFRGHSIGCERCHGPGEKHVASSGRLDIVNPAKLDFAKREAVCQQCHLEGAARVVRQGRSLDDYRPGMNLEDFWTVYVNGAEAGKERRAVNHVEQMYESKCFQKSPDTNKMGCITCHNPHEKLTIEKRAEHYRTACNKCHQKQGCSVPEPVRRKTHPDDNCTTCHMPPTATTDIVHTASADHRIIRKISPRKDSQKPTDSKLVDFFRGTPTVTDKSLARDLGMALYQLTLKSTPLSGEDGGFGIKLLSDAIRDYPGDIPAREAKGKLQQTLRLNDEAIATFEELLKRVPKHEGALVALGTMSRDLGHTEESLGYWRRAVAVNPYFAEYRKNLVVQLTAVNAWDEALPECEKWLSADPANMEARQIMVQCLIRTGKKKEATIEFDKIRALNPNNIDRLEIWFKTMMR